MNVGLVYRGMLKSKVATCAKRLAKCANLKVSLSFLETGMGNLQSTF